jgi:hypothetical protein
VGHSFLHLLLRPRSEPHSCTLQLLGRTEAAQDLFPERSGSEQGFAEWAVISTESLTQKQLPRESSDGDLDRGEEDKSMKRHCEVFPVLGEAAVAAENARLRSAILRNVGVESDR